MLSAACYKKISDIIANLLILLFVYTATSKLFAFSSFVSVLEQSPLIGKRAFTVAVVLPAAELLVALLLSFPYTRQWGFKASLLLLVVFTVYIGYMVLFIRHLTCSCGGVLQYMSWKEHFLFNTFFIGLALWGLFLERSPRKQNCTADFLALSKR